MTCYSAERKGIIFKHPLIPDFFLCWKCREYKHRQDFFKLHEWHARMCMTCSSMPRPPRPPRPPNAHDLLSDSFMISCWSMAGVFDPTPEMIEVKRQQIRIKKMLRQLKKWRKENDTTITDVPGIEHQDEVPDEYA